MLLTYGCYEWTISFQEHFGGKNSFFVFCIYFFNANPRKGFGSKVPKHEKQHLKETHKEDEPQWENKFMKVPWE